MGGAPASGNWWPAVRDILLFIVGAAGVAHETIVSQAERPTLLLLFAACLGLPAFFPARSKES